MSLKQYQKMTITVENQTDYVFGFTVGWRRSGDEWDEWDKRNTADPKIADHPTSQSRTTPPLHEIGVPADAVEVTPYGRRVNDGTQVQGKPPVPYAPNGKSATYKATTLTTEEKPLKGELQIDFVK
ncbi:hypothetical protein AU476_23470 [Cupriavidus sp. UYMSc13B]|nr:hypothetical protein AU476_23470 [Cupriavidus sp. UYMSc13B]